MQHFDVQKSYLVLKHQMSKTLYFKDIKSCWQLICCISGCDHGYCNLPNECICEEGKYIKGLVSVITSDPTKRPKPDFQRSVHLNLQLIIQAYFDTFTHTYLSTRRTYKGFGVPM